MRDTSENYNVALTIDALEKGLEASLQEGIELKKRYQNIIHRQRVLTQKNGGDNNNAQPADIISLNVSGTEMFARRDTLTIVRGSRLEALFSGRWENQLLRDAKGRVFMDVEPLVFRKVLEYLYMIKVAGGADASLELPSVSPEMKPSFDQYIDYFALQTSNTATVSNNVIVVEAKDVIVVEEDIVVLAEDEYASVEEEGNSDDNNTDSTASRVEVKDIMAKTKTELAEMEQKLEEDESFIAYFTKDSNANSGEDDKTALGASEGAYKTPYHANVSDVDFGIMNLYVNGETIAVKRSTLCFDPGSKLAQDFSDEAWLEEHWIVTETGKELVLIELPTDAFKQMVHRLQRMSIAVNKGSIIQVPVVPPTITSTVDVDVDVDDEDDDDEDEDEDYVTRVLKHYFSADHEIVKSYARSAAQGTNNSSSPNNDVVKPPSPDILLDSSVIIENDCDKLQIKEWLESAHNTSKPKLLYRASRDGWEASDFHRECDNKGATLTVVKSSEGYIFGGYSSTSWTSSGAYHDCYKSSTNAFLFSLKCFSELSPMKMTISEDADPSKAIYDTSDCGPTFGGDDDLYITSNANTEYSNVNIGYTYKLPPGTDSGFLTGEEEFLVSDYEVFQV